MNMARSLKAGALHLIESSGGSHQARCQMRQLQPILRLLHGFSRVGGDWTERELCIVEVPIVNATTTTDQASLCQA